MFFGCWWKPALHWCTHLDQKKGLFYNVGYLCWGWGGGGGGDKSRFWEKVRLGEDCFIVLHFFLPMQDVARVDH